MMDGAKTVLVTGGGGFIGTHLCKRLVRGGAEVYVAGRTPAPHLKGIARQVQLDASSFDAVDRTIAEIAPHTVVHLASSVTGNRDLSQVRPTFENNLMSTVNVLMAGTQREVERIVLTGSLEEPTIEDRGSIASSPYAAAKQASSIYAALFHALYDAPIVTLRLFMVYGPLQPDRTKLIPYVARCFLKGEAPTLASGKRAVDWIYIDDVVDAYVRAIDAPSAIGHTIDIGSGRYATIREVVERLAEITQTPVAPVFDPAHDRPLEAIRLARLEPAAEILGWHPTVNLDEGLRRTVEWLRDEGRT